MTVFDSFINLLQSGMITAFLIHCLGIKRKFQKKAAILVFVTVFFVYLEIQTFFTSFENYGVLLTLLVTGVLSFVFCEKGWIEKCICNVVILMFSVAAAIISGSIAGLIWNVGYVELVEGASAQKMAAMLFTQLLLGIFIGTFIRFQDILIDTYDLKFTLGVLSVPLISIVVVTAILSQPVTGRRDILQAGLITGGMIVVNLIVFIMMKYYYAAKYIVSCTAGGLVATIPLVVNLIANMMVLPSLKPVAALGCYAGNGIALWGDIFYTHPYIFMVLYLILIFFYQFIFVSLALLLSTWVNNRFLITLFPFLLNYFSYMMLSFIKKAKYSPIIIMDMTRINALRFGPVVLECVCLTVLFGGLYFWKQKKDEGL